MMSRVWLLAAFLVIGRCAVLKSEEVRDAQEDVVFFEEKIRPVLVEHCYECHWGSEGSAESGLRLDTREGIRAGGDRGPAVVPGDPAKSWLIQAISHQHADLQMPPDGDQLSDAVIADFVAWINRGAADPRDGAGLAPRPDANGFWAYQPLTPPLIPTVEHPGLPSKKRSSSKSGSSSKNGPPSKIDSFVWGKLRQHGLTPSPDAPITTLLRRLYFDLLGLPPSPTEFDQFATSIDALGMEIALRREVDRLLARPEFGERWGRHWLDVARFAESSGKEANITFPYAWRYRDYVIDSVGADIPVDRFVIEQLAGDLLPAKDDAERTRLLVATGFLAVGPKNLDATDPLQFAADVVDEQIDTVSRVFLASSIACARCHDHKFDPFSMEDYYALAGVFASTKTYFGTAVSPANRVSGDPLRLPLGCETSILHKSLDEKKVAALREELAALQREREEKASSATIRDALRIFWRSGAIEGELEKVDDDGRALPLAMGVLDSDQIRDAPLLLRGDVHRAARVVPRALPGSIGGDDEETIPADQSGRLQLAQWIASPQHPVTWRVMANRVWLHLFGAGLVETVDDFGSTGKPPSHPELLDYLATRLVDREFSVKRLVREIVLSRTYRQSSLYDPDSFLVDPENRFLWRMSKRRIEAEAMRDAMLEVAGQLDTRRPLGSLVGRVIGDRPVSLVGLDARLPDDLDGAVHRSVYLPVLRDRLPDVFDVFDFAEPSLVTGQRETTNVATQSLYLMNSQFVIRCAEQFAARLRSQTKDRESFVRQAFRICFARDPTEHEFARLKEFLEAEVEDARRQEVIACQALLSSAEFRILD